jgi:queuine/archaeosine tRNA-ribosyltransferase
LREAIAEQRLDEYVTEFYAKQGLEVPPLD